MIKNILLFSLLFLLFCSSLSFCQEEFMVAKKDSEQKQDSIKLDRPVEKPEASLPEIIEPNVPLDPNTSQAQQPFNKEKIIEIQVQGNKNISEDKVLSVISLKTGDIMSTDILQKDLQSIFDMGYFTDVKFEPVISSDGIKIVFRVLENPLVKRIEFKGNELLSSEDLLKLIKTKPGDVFNSNTFESDLKAINDYYTQELGMGGIATNIVDLATPEPGVFILTIKEGLKITDVKFAGNTAVTEDELKKVIATKSGDYLNILTINRDLASISKLYDEKYSLVLDEPLTAETSPEGVITFIITEARIEKFIVSGNTKTKDYVVLRELRLHEGDIINKKILSSDMQRIYNLGYFEEVNPIFKPTGKPGALIMEIQIKEGKTGLATAGVGFGGGGGRKEGITGSVTLSEKNLFGTGRSVQLTLQRGGLVSNYSINYVEPYLTRSGTSLGVTLFDSAFDEQRQPTYNISGQTYALFTDKRKGCLLTIGQPLTDELKIYGTIKISTVDSYSTPTTDNPVLALNTASGDVRSIAFSGLYDNRDDFNDTHRGIYGNFAIEKAGWLGGDFDYTKYTVDARKYFPIKTHTFAVRFLGGTSSGTVPLSEQFYLGGSDTLRGYEQGEFLGDRLFLVQVEYRFPILKSKILQGAFFFDAGNATRSDAVKGLFDDIKSDQGVGIRIAVPTLGLGVIRVDYAIKNTGGGGRIAIGIGQSF